MSYRIYSPEVKAFQEAQLERLKAMSFAQLSNLPKMQKVRPPSHIRGVAFSIERCPGEAGGVRVEVRACKRLLLIFLSCACPGFEMLPDGSLVVEVYEPPED